MIKELRKHLLIVALLGASSGSLLAGSFSATQSSPGSQSHDPLLPAGATGTQVAEGALASNTSISDGPFANLTVNGIGYKSANGTIATTGNYSVFLSETVTNGGFALIAVSW